MTTFTYTALDKTGRRLNGTLPADSRAAALDEVLGLGLSPIAINESAARSAVAPT